MSRPIGSKNNSGFAGEKLSVNLNGNELAILLAWSKLGIAQIEKQVEQFPTDVDILQQHKQLQDKIQKYFDKF